MSTSPNLKSLNLGLIYLIGSDEADDLEARRFLRLRVLLRWGYRVKEKPRSLGAPSRNFASLSDLCLSSPLVENGRRERRRRLLFPKEGPVETPRRFEHKNRQGNNATGRTGCKRTSYSSGSSLINTVHYILFPILVANYFARGRRASDYRKTMVYA